jgi:uncharacterized protein
MTLPAKRNRNVFVLPDGDRYIVYAPLAGRVLSANGDCVAQLKRYLETGDPQTVDPQVVAKIGGLGWLDDDRAPVPLPADRSFHPTMVTLFLTNGCNLRCTYCYAEAGDHPSQLMSPEIYRAAIDLVVRNARRAGREPGVGFHGGGEPTTAWETLTGAVDYARSTAGGKVRFALATNGVMSPMKAEYVAETFPMVTLSFDGPEEIHSAQRPFVDGRGSFDFVTRFIDTLRRHGTPFAVRATITERNVCRQVELVDFFVQETGCDQMHFEPVFLCGRQVASSGQALAPDTFARNFERALDRARELGTRLRYSAARLGTFLSFCGVAQDPFTVTPEGDVTGCYEVCRRDHPLADTFYFGRYQPERGRFVFRIDDLARLRALNVYNKQACNECIAKWTCSGDCPVKGAQSELDYQKLSPRCRMNQTITKALIQRALDANGSRRHRQSEVAA